jgi:hypothetical protein
MILMLAYAIHKSSWIVKSSSFLEVEAFYGDGKDNKEEETKANKYCYRHSDHTGTIAESNIQMLFHRAFKPCSNNYYVFFINIMSVKVYKYFN